MTQTETLTETKTGSITLLTKHSPLFLKNRGDVSLRLDI